MTAAPAISPSAAQVLARWATRLRLDDVPEAVRAAACRHLLDGLGTLLAAARSGRSPAVAVALALGGPSESTVLGTQQRVSAPAAALADGAQLHALDFDDTHAGGLVHATAAVLPAAFAVGEQYGADGRAVLRAAVAGYELACRITAAAPHGFHARHVHATQVASVFSAALISGLLAGDDQTTVVDALGIAGSSAGGLLEFLNTGSSTKQLHPGLGAMNGILAARLAAAGASGPSTVFEGDQGLYAALSARPADVASITADLGRRWETTSIGIKPYPACQLMHAALDAALDLLARERVDVSAVVGVRAWLHPDSAATVAEPRAFKIAPRTAYEAKFSVQWSLAALLTDGTVTVDTYSPDSLARPRVGALAGLVDVSVLDPHTVAADAPGRVEVDLADGRCLTGTATSSRGGTARPMSDADVLEKFVANCGGDAAARRLAALVLDLESAPGLDPLLVLAADLVSGSVAV